MRLQGRSLKVSYFPLRAMRSVRLPWKSSLLAWRYEKCERKEIMDAVPVSGRPRRKTFGWEEGGAGGCKDGEFGVACKIPLWDKVREKMERRRRMVVVRRGEQSIVTVIE
jgi:hypothetical protein